MTRTREMSHTKMPSTLTMPSIINLKKNHRLSIATMMMMMMTTHSTVTTTVRIQGRKLKEELSESEDGDIRSSSVLKNKW